VHLLRLLRGAEAADSSHHWHRWGRLAVEMKWWTRDGRTTKRRYLIPRSRQKIGKGGLQFFVGVVQVQQQQLVVSSSSSSAVSDAAAAAAEDQQRIYSWMELLLLLPWRPTAFGLACLLPCFSSCFCCGGKISLLLQNSIRPEPVLLF
jgi:hypothetical protein